MCEITNRDHISFMRWIQRLYFFVPIAVQICNQFLSNTRPHWQNAAPGRCVLDFFLLQFLSHPRDRSDQACFDDSVPKISWRCISESLTEWTGVVVCVCWYSVSCWKDRKCASCLSLGSVVLIFQHDPLHHLTSAPSLRNRHKPVRIQFIRLTFLVVGAVWRPVSTVWTLRLLRALFTTQETPWHIIRGSINTYFEADMS
jgi:hypothetical protein